jgi:glycosyltransferase involved in cell wall biosynthesis
VPARTPHAMAEAVSFLLNHATESERLGRMARARVLQHFTQEQFLDSYESTYCQLLARRRPQFLPAFSS